MGDEHGNHDYVKARGKSGFPGPGKFGKHGSNREPRSTKLTRTC